MNGGEASGALASQELLPSRQTLELEGAQWSTVSVICGETFRCHRGLRLVYFEPSSFSGRPFELLLSTGGTCHVREAGTLMMRRFKEQFAAEYSVSNV